MDYTSAMKRQGTEAGCEGRNHYDGCVGFPGEKVEKEDTLETPDTKDTPELPEDRAGNLTQPFLEQQDGEEVEEVDYQEDNDNQGCLDFLNFKPIRNKNKLGKLINEIIPV